MHGRKIISFAFHVPDFLGLKLGLLFFDFGFFTDELIWPTNLLFI